MHSSTLLTQHSMTAAKLNEPKYPNVSRNARSLPLHGSSGVEVYLFFFIKLRAKISAFVIKRVQRPVWLLIIGCAFTSHFLFTSYAIVFPCAMHRRSVSAYEWSDDCARGWHTLLQSCNKNIPHKSSSHTPHYTPFGTTTPANLAPPYIYTWFRRTAEANDDSATSKIGTSIPLRHVLIGVVSSVQITKCAHNSINTKVSVFRNGGE